MREPESAQQEGALLPVEPVHPGAGVVAVDQAALVGELVANGVDRGEHSWVVGGQEADDGQEQGGSVEVGAVEGLGERTEVCVPASGLDGGSDLLGGCFPGREMALGVEQVGQPDRTVQGDPAHDLRVDEMAWLPADLPDAVVGLLPACGG